MNQQKRIDISLQATFITISDKDKNNALKEQIQGQFLKNLSFFNAFY